MRKIVENYRDNNYWYRKYDDGWIEQGGTIITSISASSGYWLVFPRPFINPPVSIRATVFNQTKADSYGQALLLNTNSSYTMTNTQARIFNDGQGARPGFNWEACGY